MALQALQNVERNNVERTKLRNKKSRIDKMQKDKRVEDRNEKRQNTQNYKNVKRHSRRNIKQTMICGGTEGLNVDQIVEGKINHRRRTNR